jgi:hypothetical protein
MNIMIMIMTMMICLMQEVAKCKWGESVQEINFAKP